MKKKSIAIISAVVLFLCLAIAGVLLYNSLTAPAFLVPRVEQYLSKRLQASVQVEGLEFGLFTGAKVERLQVWPGNTVDGRADTAPIALTDIKIDHEFLPLFGGDYQPKKITVGDAELRISPRAFQKMNLGEGVYQKPVEVPKIEVEGGNVSLPLAELPEPLELENFRFSLWSEAAGKQVTGFSVFEVNGNPVQLKFNAMPEDARFETRFYADGFNFSGLPVKRKETIGLDLSLLKLAGSMFGKLSVRLPSDILDTMSPRISGEFAISDFSVSHPEVAVGLEDGFASFKITENGITLNSGRFETAGGSVEIPAAGVKFRDQKVEKAWIRAEADGLRASLLEGTRLASQLPEAFQVSVESGTVSGEGRLQWTPSEGFAGEGDVEIANVNGSMPEKDVRFSGLDAGVKFTSAGQISISRLAVESFGGRFMAEGTCEIVEGTLKYPRFDIRLKDVPKLDELMNLVPVPAQVQDFIASIDLEKPILNGVMNIDGKDISLDLTVDAESAEPSQFPLPVEDIKVDLSWSSGADRLLFKNARAEVEDSPLKAEGAVIFGPPVRLDLNLSGHNFPLNNEILEWCGLELKDWNAEGVCDVELYADEWSPSGDNPSEMLNNLDIQLDVRNVSLEHQDGGEIAEHISSSLTLDNKGIQFLNLTGISFGVAFRGGGWLPWQKSQRRGYLYADSEDIALEASLYDRLPFDLDLEELGLSGQLELKAELSGHGSNLKNYIGSLSTTIHQLELMPKNKKITSSGKIHLRGAVEDWHKSSVDGLLQLKGISYGNLEAERLTADFSYKNRRLNIAEMLFRTCGGKVKLTEADIDLSDKQWSCAAEISHLDLETLIRSLDRTIAKSPSGIIHGEVNLKGRGPKFGALSGQGEVKVSRGRLYDFPLLMSVFSVLNLKMPRKSSVTDAYGEFDIEQGQFDIKNALFFGGSVPAHLQGTISFDAPGTLEEKPIDLLFTIAKEEGVLDKIPLLNWAKHYTVDYLRGIIFQAKVKGKLGDYKVQTLSSPIMGPIKNMFSLVEKYTPSPPEK